MKIIKILCLLVSPLIIAMDMSSAVKKYSFDTINAGELQHRFEHDFESITKDKALHKKLDDLIKDGKKQVKNEEERTAFSWCKMATATTICLVGAGTGVAIGLATGNLALLFPLTTAPFGFTAGWMVDKGDTKKLQAMQKKLALLQKISTQLKEQKQINKLEQEAQAAEAARLKKREQYEKKEQGRQFKELAQKNQKKQARENEKRNQKTQATQIACAPAAIAASSTPHKVCTCSAHMSELEAIHERVVASQKAQQQAHAGTSSRISYEQANKQYKLYAASPKNILPSNKRYQAYGRTIHVNLTQQGKDVMVHEWTSDVYATKWEHQRKFVLSYDQAIEKYGEVQQ